jgi:undecaprenyl-diphosphatase
VLDLIVLGVIQGLTEFLPVSSTAHLVFAEHFLGIRRPGLLLEGVLHLGTVLAAIVLFWPDVVRLVRAGLGVVAARRRPPGAPADPYTRLAAVIVAATAVTGVLGLVFERPLERMFSSVRGVAFQLIITGLLLFWHRERGQRAATDATVGDGLALGLAQAVAIIPGISRSGTTIITGLGLGLQRIEATRLSFLMAIPAVAGAGALTLRDAREAATLGYTVPQFLVGFAVAALVGAASIRWLMGVVRRGRLGYFGAYCCAAGLLVLAVVR